MTPAREAGRRLVAEGALTLSSSGRVSTPELSNERIEELAALRALIEPELASPCLAACAYGPDRAVGGNQQPRVCHAVAHQDAVRLYPPQPRISPHVIFARAGTCDVGDGRNDLVATWANHVEAIRSLAPHRTAAKSQTDPCRIKGRGRRQFEIGGAVGCNAGFADAKGLGGLNRLKMCGNACQDATELIRTDQHALRQF